VVYALGRELDALFYILGILTGIFRFGATRPGKRWRELEIGDLKSQCVSAARPGIARFNVSGALGSLTLPVWLNLNTARQSRNSKFKI